MSYFDLVLEKDFILNFSCILSIESKVFLDNKDLNLKKKTPGLRGLMM